MTVVHEWHVEGDASTEAVDYGPYHFVYRSDDKTLVRNRSGTEGTPFCGTVSQ